MAVMSNLASRVVRAVCLTALALASALMVQPVAKARDMATPGSAPGQHREAESVPVAVVAANTPEPGIAASAARPSGGEAAAANTPEYRAEWAVRIALIEKYSGQLTLAKALSLLLDVADSDGLQQLAAHERELMTAPWRSAYALGINQRGGLLVWGAGFRWREVRFAVDAALEACSVSPGEQCKVVTINDQFFDKAFLEAVRGLGASPVDVVRHAYLGGLKSKPFSRGSDSTRGLLGGAFSSARD
jgi:hypothetical protein